jgi:bifunctional DNase/RNase
MDKELRIFGYNLDAHQVTQARLIELKDKKGKEMLKVPMEMFAVTAIFRYLIKQEKPSVPAHKMFLNVIEALGGKVKKIVIDDLRAGKFFATLHFTGGKGQEYSVKAEAGDAITIAICAPRCEICVMESIVYAAKNDRDNRVYWYSSDNEESLKEVRKYSVEELVKLPDDDLGQLLEIATQIEDFSFAARVKEAMDVHEGKKMLYENEWDAAIALEKEKVMAEIMNKMAERFGDKMRIRHNEEN